jgi:hypothetical protein
MKPHMTNRKYYRKELWHSLVKKYPENIVTALSFISAIIVGYCGQNLTELERRVLGGIVSSFVFYIFIQILPKIETKKAQLNKVLSEVRRGQQILSHFEQQLHAEGQTANWQFGTTGGTFFNILQTVNTNYVPPQGSALRQVAGTTNTNPPTFHYANLGQVLMGIRTRIDKFLDSLEQICSIYGVENIDPALSEKAFQLQSTRMNPAAILAQLQHINNSAALFGTDFDLISDGLNKIQKHILDQVPRII